MSLTLASSVVNCQETPFWELFRLALQEDSFSLRASIDGIRSRWQELWYITLPQLKSQLMFGAVMQITSSLSVAEVSTQIAGFPSVNYAGHTIITHLMDYGNIRMEMGYASAIATVLFIIMILANVLVRKILRRVGN